MIFLFFICNFTATIYFFIKFILQILILNDIGCYIIWSDGLERFYIGACQSNLIDRIIRHNTSYYGEACYTSRANDWQLYIFIPTRNFAHAIRLEKKIKRMKSKMYIENLKKYPEMIQKITYETA